MSAYERAMWEAADYARYKVAERASGQLNTLSGGAASFYPTVDMDACKFGVGVVDDYHYLVYQNDGFATFPMWSLQGKVIPMLINGQRVFRRASKINLFSSRQPNPTMYWRRNSNGELLQSSEPRRRWVHPGLGRKGFIEAGVEDAARERANDIFHALLEDMEA